MQQKLEYQIENHKYFEGGVYLVGSQFHGHPDGNAEQGHLREFVNHIEILVHNEVVVFDDVSNDLFSFDLLMTVFRVSSVVDVRYPVLKYVEPQARIVRLLHEMIQLFRDDQVFR